MNANQQVLDNDLGNNASKNAPNDGPAIDWTSSSQHHTTHAPAAACPSLPQLSGGGVLGSLTVCVQCHCAFPNNAQLNKHAKDTSHKSYECTCGARFGRSDALVRHINAKSGGASKYTCEYCGPRKGFYRPDHLNQHMRLCHAANAEDQLLVRNAGANYSDAGDLSIATGSVAVAGVGDQLLGQLTGIDQSNVITSAVHVGALNNDRDYAQWNQVPSVPWTVPETFQGEPIGYVPENNFLDPQNMMVFPMAYGYDTKPQFPNTMPVGYEALPDDMLVEFGQISDVVPLDDGQLLIDVELLNNGQFDGHAGPSQTHGQDGSAQF
ncbi:uncharacterized protein F4822DRAFT_443895 [Hypoxylon trugodes]|uniref:uncharacterized protein n=1 Tax=Hypoxylon trugodes TaxID=326681 RepID=UPI0021912CF7|nr:uncharacterized protein F4822DRAFT_443895 [Hypoxylon trugodes]KAI1389205.1 hypothetical protein F4822DRAFT_443895 [Hypoxylon trugodes]